MTVERDQAGVLHARNVRGGSLPLGLGDDGRLTPTELLLSALAELATPVETRIEG